MSGLVNKAKEVIHNVTHHDDKTHTNTAGMTSGAPEGIAGPHGSRVANAADPRVDSDLDNRAQYGTGLTGSTTTTGTGVGTHSSTNVGPHSSNIANKLDPRVDSDLDGGRHAGLNQTTGTHTTHTTKTGTGFDGTSTGSTNAGPHSSNLMNKVDPRVDSDLDGGRHAGLNQTTHPSTGHPSTTGATAPGADVGNTTSGSTNAGPHNSNLLNKADPRVDSDLDGGRHAGLNQTTHPSTGHPSITGASAPGAGVGNTTLGSTNADPHNSNLLNKLDPRVDSDLDASRNAGLNQTTRP